MNSFVVAIGFVVEKYLLTDQSVSSDAVLNLRACLELMSLLFVK